MKTKLMTKANFTEGKILKKLFWFIIPMAFAQLLQILFNAADIAVVGQFSGANGSFYQAAVGAASSTVLLITELFIGLSVGVNVAIANAFGAKDKNRQHDVTHTSMLLSLVCGFIVLIVGVTCCKSLLLAMNTPSNIIDYATKYLQIYFIGAPFMLVYNFGASLMRGVGETRKPLLYLFVAGVINIGINILTVVCFDMHVIGVALGTVISQAVSAVWIVIDLARGKYGVKLTFRKLRFCKREVKYIMYIGLPMGLSTCCFSLSNIFVQTAINGYGAAMIAGNTVGTHIHTILEAFSSSTESAVVTVVGQNMGAKKPERLNRVIGAGLFLAASFQVTYAVLMLVGGKYACMIFNRDPVVIKNAMKRIMILTVPNVLMCFHFALGGALRGMGRSIAPMIINLFFTCVVRLIYLFIIYPIFPGSTVPMPTIETIYIIYPITWVCTGVCYTVMYFVIQKRTKKKMQAEPPPLKDVLPD